MKASTAPLDLDPRQGSGGGGCVGFVQGKPAGGARPSTRAGQQGRCRLEAPGGAGGRGSASLTHTRRGGSQVRPTSEFRSRRGARPALQGKDFQTTHVSPVAPKCPGGSQARLRPRRHRAAPRTCLPVPGRHGGSRCPAGRRGLGAPDQPVPGRRAWGLELSLSAEPDPLGCWQPATRRKPTCRKRAGKRRGPCGHSRPRVSCRPRLSPAPLGLRGSWRLPPTPTLLPVAPFSFSPPRPPRKPVSPTESYYVRPGSGGRKSPQSQRGESRQGAAGGSALRGPAPPFPPWSRVPWSQGQFRRPPARGPRKSTGCRGPAAC